MSERICQFSPCAKYRYTLWREWSGGNGYAQFIGLNPSTADDKLDDPTIRRCRAFAQSWGYSAMCMTNLFAWRDKDPKKMKAVSDPIGPENDRWLREIASQAGVIVAAWGKHGSHLYRATKVKQMLSNLHYLRLNYDGSPEHPLYLPAILKPIPMTTL